MSSAKEDAAGRDTRRWAAVMLLAMVALLAVLLVDLLPLLRQVVEQSGKSGNLTAYFTQYGLKGVPILIGLQALCVLLVVVPDSPIQVLAGICYGVVGGTLVSLAGLVLGNLALFVGVRLFKRSFPGLGSHRQQRKRARKKHLVSLATIENSTSPARLVLLLYVIPGIPSGPLPYLFAQSRITLLAYTGSMAIGTLPSLVITTLVGKMIDAKRYAVAIVVALIYGAILLAALLWGKKILKKAGVNTAPEME